MLIQNHGQRRAATAADAEAAAARRAGASSPVCDVRALIGRSHLGRLGRVTMLRLTGIRHRRMRMRRHAMMRMYMPGMGLCGKRHDLNSDQNDHRRHHSQELHRQRHAGWITIGSRGWIVPSGLPDANRYIRTSSQSRQMNGRFMSGGVHIVSACMPTMQRKR